MLHNEENRKNHKFFFHVHTELNIPFLPTFMLRDKKANKKCNENATTGRKYLLDLRALETLVFANFNTPLLIAVISATELKNCY